MSGKSSRFCNARQTAIDYARKLIDSEECTYGIKQADADKKISKVGELLHEEAFHFGLKANSVSGQ
jgi:hypothetical protein